MKNILPHSMKKVCHNDRNVVKLAYAKPPSTDPKIGTFLGRKKKMGLKNHEKYILGHFVTFLFLIGEYVLSNLESFEGYLFWG